MHVTKRPTTLQAYEGDDWLQGMLHGREGIFPVTFVEVIEELPQPTAAGSAGAGGGASEHAHTDTSGAAAAAAGSGESIDILKGMF